MFGGPEVKPKPKRTFGDANKGTPSTLGNDRDRGRGGGGERRGPRREEHGSKGAAEATILLALKDLEKPMNLGDLEGQKAPLARIVEKIRGLRLKSIDDLEFDCRTRLFTALLRAGRQAPVTGETEEEKAREAKRKELSATLGEIWRALNDDRRAALAFASAGKTEPAMKMLNAAGEWQEVAGLHLREGRPLEAARLFEQHKEYDKAMHAFEEAKDFRGVLRTALFAGRTEDARKAAREVPHKIARELLLKAGKGDLYLDLLASRGEWFEIGELYERAEQWPDAAMAFERARRLTRALKAFQQAGDTANAARIIDLEVASREARGDPLGAADFLRKHGQFERAAARILESRPDLSFKWLQEGGFDQQALEPAAKRARLAAEAGNHVEAAEWLERRGELPEAAEAFLRANQPARALKLYEQLGSWEAAAEAAAKAGEQGRALEFFQRAGVADPEARVQALAASDTSAPK